MPHILSKEAEAWSWTLIST